MGSRARRLLFLRTLRDRRLGARNRGDLEQDRAGVGVSGFLDRLVDWRDFEGFVRDLYARHPDVDVQHNVTEVGKSGAPRQIDVKFTHRAAGHTYVTLVECKRWKEKVTRDRIDVLAAGMKDLNAAKGVMFTTTGYEPGAEAYAESEGIEIFVVRDLTDEEWGRPGRVVWFWMHFYGGQMTNINSGPVQFLAVGQAPPRLKLDLQVGENVPPSPHATLYSPEDGSAGPNLMDLLVEARRRVLAMVAQEVTVFDEGAEGAVKAFNVPVLLDLKRFPYRELRQPFGVGRLERISMELLVTVSQSRFEYDRAGELDLALAIENFMTRQRQVVTRARASSGVAAFDLQNEAHDRAGSSDVLENGMVMQVFLEPWVQPPPLQRPPAPARSLSFTLPSWDVQAAATPGEAKSDAASSGPADTEMPS